MQPIPDDILKQFDAVLEERAVPVPQRADYREWLRYYLDFHLPVRDTAIQHALGIP